MRQHGALDFQAVQSVGIGLELRLKLRKSLQIGRLLLGHLAQMAQFEGA